MSRAAVLTRSGGGIEIVDDVQVERPKAGEALVDIDAAGVCGSDLALLTGKFPQPLPVVLGHEATGLVTELGDDRSELAVGDRVTLWLRPPCRSCRMCIRGEAALCERTGIMSAKGILPDGRTGLSRRDETIYRGFGVAAFATQALMPTTGLVKLPEDIPTEVAALLGCGVATGAGAVLNVARPEPGDVVLVFGAGGVGLAAAMTAAASPVGAVVVVDPAAHRRETALELGADPRRRGR